MKYREEIKEMLHNSQEDISMQGMIDHVLYKLRLEAEEATDFFIEMLKLQGEGQILYDGKHDVWFWLNPMPDDAILLGGKQ